MKAMKISIRIIVLIIVSLFGLWSCGDVNEVTVTNLTCEYQTNPLGIDVLQPRFSWQLESAARNKKQASYQILVSENPVNLKKDTGEIWDSKRINSDQSLLIPFAGKKLEPGRQYFWKVKVWDQDNKESTWSEAANFRTGLFGESDWNNAKWIGYEDLSPEKRVVPGVHGNGDELGEKCKDRPVVPLFRKEFEVNKTIQEATLYITGLGQYEASINGHKVGSSFLSPGWTNYDKTVLYNSYDVTSIIRQGKNAIGAIVGNGFYNINRERYRKITVAWGNPKLVGQLRIRFTDGSEQILVTGPDWKTSPSPITFTSIYGGEDYDAQLEQAGWNQPGFNDSSWKNAVLVTVPQGKLTKEKDFPIEIKRSFSVKVIRKLNDGSFLYDFGQNASGIVELQVKGKKGQLVRLTPSELITKDGQPNQSAVGYPSYFSYILKGDGIEVWRPRFSYTGFRYVKVEGALPGSEKSTGDSSQLIDLKLLHNRNSAPLTGTFLCSNDLFNRTYTLINWAIQSNLQSVLTDCPHREKLGWLEVNHLMGSAIHFNLDIYQLYSKQVNDMMEAQLENGLVPDIAPEYVPFLGGFRDSPEWGSASVILPWLIYKWYGDVSVLKKAWPMMLRYVEYLKSKSENHIVSYGLGDWFDYGPNQPGEAQLTPKSLTATSSYYYDVKLLSEIASVLEKTDEQSRLEKWAVEIKTAFNARFFNPKTGVISTGSQTSMAMPLCVGLIDDQFQAKVLQNLEDSIRAQGKPLTAGDVGFHYLVEALTNGGKSQLLYEMNARDDVPGYGFQLKKGATSLTESWAALENVSNNHLMLGHLMDWFYTGLGGIGQTKKSVAYKEIVIKPEMVGDITWAKTSYQSAYGEIRSDWEKSGSTVKMNISIPANASALVYIPVTPESIVKEGGKDILVQKDIQFTGEEKGRKIYKVGSGDYSFSVEKK
jgi:alpha-L-rhamnosidase